MKDHYFCDVCKKLGKKRRDLLEKKRHNMPEYEVYRDLEELRKHYKKKHLVCDYPNMECIHMVFEDST